MPNYPARKTFKAGFYNSKNVNGTDDRVYTAEDVRKPYDVIYTDGIKPDPDGTTAENLRVVVVGEMDIAVKSGHAKLGGAWFENESNYVIGLDGAGGTDRYDCVILRNDDSDAVRAPSIYIKSLSTIPTLADLIRNNLIYEVCLAYVRVPALATSITQSNITDTRDDGSLCNVMSGVGATVTRTYHNTYFSESTNQTVIPIGIEQYSKSRDKLTVIVEGRIFSEGVQYKIDNDFQITLTVGLPVVGTKIDFEVIKNVNAAGADTVVQEVGVLIDTMASVNKMIEHHYYCNGINDNVKIGQLVTAFQNGASDNSSMRLVIHGTFGANAPAGGEGTSENSYYWMRAAQGSATSRRVILDFTDCRQIAINCPANTHNIIFFGMDTQIIGANVVATGGASIQMFSAAGGASIYAENCRLWVTTEAGGLIARSGTFRNCRASVTNATGHSYCFAPISASLLRLFGGEYYAYTASMEHVSAIVGVTSGTNALAILYAVNAPTSARSGYMQTHSLYQTTGMISSTDLISALEMNVISGQSNIRGTLAFSKAGLM